jgi:hypothetical protein
MQVHIYTDHHVHGHADFLTATQAEVESTLSRFAERITRVEAHLSDTNAGKGGPNDKRCLIEVRLNGIPPMVVSHEASLVEKALTGALEKMERAIDSHLGKLGHQR